MEKIDLTAGAAGGDAAFDDGKMRAAGLDDASLSQLLASSIRPLAALVRDGCGVGFTITGDRANIFGLTEADAAEKCRAEAITEELEEALRPFAAFAQASGFDRIPDDVPMTHGSRLAHRQVTAGDFKRALRALAVLVPPNREA